MEGREEKEGGEREERGWGRGSRREIRSKTWVKERSTHLLHGVLDWSAGKEEPVATIET